MELQFVFAFFLALVALYALVHLLYLPFRMAMALIYNGVVGGFLLWVVNLGGGFFGFHVGLNPITAVTAGLLGIPGVAGLVLLRSMLF